jgi:Zn-finger in ubiquitin-hydrolases and other protein
MQKNCEHFMGIQEDEQVNPHTKGCEECEKEGSNWVALRMCLSCGHVGCCDSSSGFMQLNTMKIQDILQ